MRALILTSVLLGLSFGCSASLKSKPGGNGAGANSGGSSSTAGGSSGGASGGLGGLGGLGGSSGGTGGGMTTPPILTCGVSKVSFPMLRRLSAREYVRSLQDIFPTLTGQWTSELSPDPTSKFGFDNDASALVVGKQTAQELFDTATSLAKAISTNINSLEPCAAATPDRSCASSFVTDFGKKLYRRPLTQPEVDDYLTFFDTVRAKMDFPTSISWLARGLIQSPATAYRSEIGKPSATSPTTYTLNQYEIATMLSYTYAGTTPAQNVLDAADNNQITPDFLVTGAGLLLQSSNYVTVQRFFTDYVAYNALTIMTKTADPNFSNPFTYNGAQVPAYRDQMVQETQAFIQNVIIDNKGGTKELFTSPSTNPTASLAAFYGFPAPGTDFASVTRPAGRGIGLLAQASVLASRSDADMTSPTKRGLLVFTRFLCKDKPQVPAGVPPPTKANTGQTTRQHEEQDHAQGMCHDCHQYFDPIGFGSEHYDELGRWRDLDNGLTIDTASNVPNTDDLTKPLFSFTDLESLASGLAALPETSVCMSAYLSIGTFGLSSDCLGEARRQDFIDGKIGVVDYLESLAGEPQFTQRSTAPTP